MSTNKISNFSIRLHNLYSGASNNSSFILDVSGHYKLGYRVGWTAAQLLH
jgi:hypothetical protein